MNPESNSAEITKASGSNFVSSFGFLSKEKQNDLTVIYAYCRLTDDIVDRGIEQATGGQTVLELENWRKETSKAFQSKSNYKVLQELQGVVDKYKIPHDYFHQLIDGVRMDLDKKSYQTFEELYPYCYRVASIVGLTCLEVFGYRNPKTKDYAVNLGISFQLTNIIRDIKTDAQRARIYIPEEDFKKFGFNRETLLNFVGGSFGQNKNVVSFKNLVDFECKRAIYYYRKSKECLLSEDRSNLIAAEVMNAVYYALLTKIQKNPLAVLRTKVRLSSIEMGLRIFQGWVTNRLRF